MQLVVGAPIEVLAALGGQDAGQRRASQAQQGAQRLRHRSPPRALAGKDLLPTGSDPEKGFEQGHGLGSGDSSRAKVFFSVR